MGSWRVTPAVAALALATACGGPRVRVTHSAVHAGAPGHAAVEALLENRGGGGEVKVIARIRERVSGRMYVAAREADVRARESVWIVVEVPAPAGDYDAEVTADFPP